MDLPSPNLEKWKGNVFSSQLKRVTNLEIRNLLLRGCTLRNTNYVYGIAVYLGKESKILQNAKASPRKISALMKLMNYMLYTVFCFQLIIIIILSSMSMAWRDIHQNSQNYLETSSVRNIGTWFIQMLTYWVAYSHMIPISLYVIIEVLKLK